jgi:hypothetical protein
MSVCVLQYNGINHLNEQDIALKLKLRYTAVLHLGANMEKELEVDAGRVRKQLQLFLPVGSCSRKETATKLN